jgi:N-6 DNA Methylase
LRGKHLGKPSEPRTSLYRPPLYPDVPLPKRLNAAPSLYDGRRHGVYLTPAALVETALDLSLPHLQSGPLTVVDPSCGDGGFLAAASARLPAARLFGLELSAPLARQARARAPRARVLVGDGLREGWAALQAALPRTGVELWLGNPPYNGTSPLLKDPEAYKTLLGRVGLDEALPRGTSLRDDFAFFLLLASAHLRHRHGVLAWVTSATLLDAFLYAPLRKRLLDSLALEEVVDLGAGLFRNTRVRTCLSVWRASGPRRRARFRERLPGEGLRFGPETTFVPQGPEWTFRPTSPKAAALDAAWRARGEPLDRLLPIQCTGLKTRFDELLVDADAEALLERVDAFLSTPQGRLAGFARAHGLSENLVPKLEALRRTKGLPKRAARASLRPFFRYAGAKHRNSIPTSARAFCYLDRRLIPRGDHRLSGHFDPHLHPVKLVFNLRELPLSAALLEAPGCIPAHRHARFAPLEVPERVWALGTAAGRGAAGLGPLVPNLSSAGRAWAEGLGGPRHAFERIVCFINSPEVQDVWAPAFGRSRALPVPLDLAPGGAGSVTLRSRCAGQPVMDVDQERGGTR